MNLYKQTFLSFDVATKSLAYILINIEIESDSDISNINNFINYIKNNYDYSEILNYVEILEGDVVNLMDENDKLSNSKSVEKARRLKNITQRLLRNYEIDKVYIEDQMAMKISNVRILENLKMEFALEDVEVIGASLKNLVYYSDELRIQNYYEKYKTKYTANKNHSKNNFKYVCEKLNCNILQNIKKKNHDDISDAFNQIIGVIFNK